MIANIHNENFGYSTACYGNWAAIGNPDILRYDPVSSSIYRTGSVEVYRYNTNTDTHVKKGVLYRPLTSEEEIFIVTEGGNSGSTGPDFILHTEYTGSVTFTSDLDLIIDIGSYYTASEDGYGHSVDIYDKLLAVGNPYFLSNITIGTASFEVAGSGSVDLFDLTKLDIDPYIEREETYIISSSVDGGFYTFFVSVPSGQGFGYAAIEYSDTISGSYQRANFVAVSNAGGTVEITTNLTSINPPYVRSVGIINTNPYLISITNPNPAVTESFGHDVSLNNEWLAISSIYESGSLGSVFMYRKQSGNNASWSLFQTINPPSDIGVDDAFGYSLDLNKHSGSFSGSLIVGSLKPSASRAYVYEFESGSWTQKFTLYPETLKLYPLTFFDNVPIVSGSYPNISDNFGHDVAIYKDTILVGAPTDRFFYEYTGSSVYRQGAAYFFERCSNRDRGYYLARKSYGNENTTKNNLFGISVSVFDDYAVVGSPKIDLETQDWTPIYSICYHRGTIYQQHFCNNSGSQKIDGQFVLYNKSTGSIPDTTGIDWDITNVYQVKKRLLQPYRTYGFSVDICENFITVGAPFFISGSDRVMDLNPTIASFTGSVDDLGDLCGKAYIYNLNNLREEFYVGNVFYRNGKVVIMSSGSSFDGLLMTDISSNAQEYEMEFQSKQIIFEKQIVCPVEPGEFNVSTNPTAIVLPSSSYDLNQNGQFDFQDVDVLLRYMKYKSTETDSSPSTDWSSSIITTSTDEEITVYSSSYANWKGTDVLFSSSFSYINNTLATELDFNEDNKIDNNDMNILWKYFIRRLTQKNYETYITPNSQKKYLSDIIDYLNERTLRGKPPLINSNFSDYTRLSKLDPTGSYLASYVTTIGLYDGTELVAVAKLGAPIKITPDFPINFIVKMDF